MLKKTLGYTILADEKWFLISLMSTLYLFQIFVGHLCIFFGKMSVQGVHSFVELSFVLNCKRFIHIYICVCVNIYIFWLLDSYVIGVYILPFSTLSFHLIIPFSHSFWFSWSLLYLFFSLVACAFSVVSKNRLPKPKSCRFTPMYSSKSFMILALIFESFFSFELIFIYGVRQESNFFLSFFSCS